MSSGLPNLDAPSLLGDVGGTNARFALLTKGVITDIQSLDGSRYPTIAHAARAYLESVQTAPPLTAAIAIAAPLIGDEVRMTNHSWRFSVSALRAELQLNRLIVLNDFTALAMSLRHLPKEDLVQLGGSTVVANAPIALIGPGTGLGVSGLIPQKSGNEIIWAPLQGEGGHATLAPCSEREEALVRELRRRFGHVSAERAISGPGLINIYTALCALDGVQERLLQPSDITELALQGSDAQCVDARHLFCTMLGTMAGNLALTLGAVGGVFIGGGIVPKLGDYFLHSEFRPRFEDKGRYRSYLAQIPAFVIRSAAPAFYGLARSLVDPSPRVEA